MTPSEPTSSTWRVHVLCAQWCGVCRDYRAFVDAQQGGVRADWVWVDIETHADALGDLDIENFPTLIVTEATQVRFFGPVTPQPEVAERLIQSLQDGNRYAVPDLQMLQGIALTLRNL